MDEFGEENGTSDTVSKTIINGFPIKAISFILMKKMADRGQQQIRRRSDHFKEKTQY